MNHSEQSILQELPRENNLLGRKFSRAEKKRLKQLSKITSVEISKRSAEGNINAMKALKSIINTIRR